MTGQAHYLRRNKACWTPARVVILDTESRLTPSPRGRIHRFRLGCATFDHRRTLELGGPPADRITVREDPAELWAWVDAHTDRSETTHLYAHHLAYDLAVGRALPAMIALGWEVLAFSTIPAAPFVRLGKGRRRLVLADTFTWFPAPLADIARRVGMEKGTLPTGWDADPSWSSNPSWAGMDTSDQDPEGWDAWETYCANDVDILRAAVLEAMAWWDAEDAGRWWFTGASCGWAHYRHRFYDGDLLIHREPDALALERAAYYGGRRECFRVGEVPGGPFPYLDYRTHYADVARRIDVPVQLLYTSEGITPESYRRRPKGTGLIAEVEIDSDRAVLPVRTVDGVVYPVGRFTTTVAGPEFELALRTARTVRVLRGAYYRLGPLLRRWGDWITGQLDPERASVPPTVQLMVKGWSRSVVGKFGQAGRETTRGPDCLPDDFASEGLVDADDGRRGTLTRCAGSTFVTWTGTEPENAAPAVAAWIASQARVELWDLIQAAGPDRVVWCDTDAVILDGRDCPDPREQPPGPEPEGRPQIQAPEWWLDPAVDPAIVARLQVKAVYSRVSFHLPGDYELDGRPVVKGLPGGARMIGPRNWRAELWPGMPWQMAEHRGQAFETWDRDLQYRADYTRGTVLPDGRVVPLELDQAPAS